MDDNNHDMLGVLAREMNAIFGPLIQNINRTNQENAAQMTRIADFFGAPDAPTRRRQNPMVIRNEEPTIEQIRPPIRVVEERNVGARLRQQEVQEDQNEQPRPIMIVNRDQNADEVVHRTRNDNLVAENNLTTMIERIMAQNGLNSGFRRPNYASPIVDYVL